MSSSCTPILMGVVSPVSEILLPSKTAKFPFWGMDYSPWSSKNLIDRNRLKKFMQVGIDVKFIDTGIYTMPCIMNHTIEFPFWKYKIFNIINIISLSVM